MKRFQQDATIAFILRDGFTLHVSGDNSTFHQEYNAVYGLSGRQVYCKLTKTVITLIFYTTANIQSQVDHINPTYYPGGDGIVIMNINFRFLNIVCSFAPSSKIDWIFISKINKKLQIIAQLVLPHTDRLFVTLRRILLEKWLFQIISTMKLKMQDITGWILFFFGGGGGRNAGWVESMWLSLVS